MKKLSKQAANVFWHAAWAFAQSAKDRNTRRAYAKLANELSASQAVSKERRVLLIVLANFVQASLEDRTWWTRLMDRFVPARRREVAQGRAAVREVIG